MHGSIAPGRLDPDVTFLLVVDMQEPFSKVIEDFDSIVSSIVLIARVAKLLGMPIIGTEQAPDKLGRTVQKIDLLLERKFEKRYFDVFKDERIREEILGIRRKNVILTGIETHICVLQTALSALSLGLEVHLVSDATGSSFPGDKDITILRLLQEGIYVTTAESVIYELLGTSDHPKFREVVELVKSYRVERRGK